MINVSVVRSPGWWFDWGACQISKQRKDLEPKFKRLQGDGPLPGDCGKDDLVDYRKRSRSTWEDRITEACVERLKVDGFRTAVDSDSNGDAVANGYAESAQFFAALDDTLYNMVGVGIGFQLAAKAVLPNLTEVVTVTNEDPRTCWTYTDPATGWVLAGGKQYWDAIDDIAYAKLWAFDPDGNVRQWTTFKKDAGKRATFMPDWSWDSAGPTGVVLEGLTRVPLVPFVNHKGVSDWEFQIDVLDRIADGKLKRQLLQATQVFQQRAIIGSPDRDEEGEPIDYNKVLEYAPDALWRFPEGTSVESFPAMDITGTLEADKDDVKELCALTATPVPVLMPGTSNQSAEGAAFAKEQLVFRAEKRKNAATLPCQIVLSLVCELNDDPERSTVAEIDPIWADVARRSLVEMADADSKAAKTLPLEERLVKIWQYSPARAAQIAALKRAEDMQMLAMANLASLTPANVETPPLMGDGDVIDVDEVAE